VAVASSLRAVSVRVAVTTVSGRLMSSPFAFVGKLKDVPALASIIEPNKIFCMLSSAPTAHPGK
jgi:hypothetical protein